MCEVKEYVNYQTGEKLDVERAIHLKDNAMLKVNPHLWSEWDFEKNDELGLDIWSVTKGSHKKAWWICLTCNSSYDTVIYHRINNKNCPYCRGLRVNHTNSLSYKNPQLAKQWHPTKNGELTPYDVTHNSGKNVWWLGECGHEWKSIVDNRNKGRGCPYCTNVKVLKGFNDMWTTNPELASILLNPEDGYIYIYIYAEFE